MERSKIQKLFAVILAAAFAGASINAIAQDKKDEPKKQAARKDAKKSGVKKSEEGAKDKK